MNRIKKIYSSQKKKEKKKEKRRSKSKGRCIKKSVTPKGGDRFFYATLPKTEIFDFGFFIFKPTKKKIFLWR